MDLSLAALILPRGTDESKIARNVASLKAVIRSSIAFDFGGRFFLVALRGDIPHLQSAPGLCAESRSLIRQELLEYLVYGFGLFADVHPEQSSSSIYCGGLLPTRLITFGYFPLDTFSSIVWTSIWCHQSSP